MIIRVFNHFHKQKAAGPQNKAIPHHVGVNCSTMKSPQQWESSDWATGAICWGHQDADFAPVPFPRAQITTNSSVGCFHFASTYGTATAGEGSCVAPGRVLTITQLHWLRGVSFAGKDSDEDQPKSPWGSPPRCGEKLFPTVIFYRSLDLNISPKNSVKPEAECSQAFSGPNTVDHWFTCKPGSSFDLQASIRKWVKTFARRRISLRHLYTTLDGNRR